MEKVVSNYLKYIGIPISSQFVKKRIVSHPDYPSILAVSDTLTQLKIPHSVSMIQSKTLNDVQFPVLLHIDQGYGTLIQLNSREEGDSVKDTLDKWSGVVVNVKPVKQVISIDNDSAIKKEIRFKFLSSILFVALTVFLFTPAFISFSWVQFTLLTSASIGLLIGYFLFAKDIGITFQAIENFCSSGTGAGCGSETRSVEFLGFIKLSDLALCYFIVQLFAIGILGAYWPNLSILYMTGVLGIATIPALCYTVWIQAFILKTWCRLCLIISGIMIFQAFIFGYIFSLNINSFTIDVTAILAILLLFMIVLPSLLLIKQIIHDKNIAIQNEVAGSRLKNSADIFIRKLQEQHKVDVSSFENDILIGNKDALIKFTVVLNLFCTPCKNEVNVITELLSVYPDKFSVTFRFVKNRDEHQTTYRIAYQWIHRLNKDGGIGLDLLNKWYSAMNPVKFAELFPCQNDMSDSDTLRLLHEQHTWITSCRITKTPAFFLNGYGLPIDYRVKDMTIIIPLLEDELIKLQSTA